MSALISSSAPITLDELLNKPQGRIVNPQGELFSPAAARPRKCPGEFIAATDPDIMRLVGVGAAVAIGVSGGKDSVVATGVTMEYLDSLGHTGPRVLVHADLGMVEWKESVEVCRQLANHYGLELLIVSRKAGGLMERWESRWESSTRRYSELSTVTLVLPWSTPAMRFCQSETKRIPIISELRRRFKGQHIINVTGIRRQESASRSKSTIADLDVKNSRVGSEFWNFRPIVDFSTQEVFQFIKSRGLPLHIAYTEFHSSRVSCILCILAKLADLVASTRRPEHRVLYRRMVALEIVSTFAFQGSRWLGDVAPHLLLSDELDALEGAKDRAKRRQASEAEVPKDLLYTKGWPNRMVTQGEAELLASVRNRVADAVGLQNIGCTDAESVMARYDELLRLKELKLAA